MRFPTRSGIAALAMLALTLLPLGASAEELSRERAGALEKQLRSLARDAMPKTVMVQGVIGLGTGAVVDGRGTVVTNAHVAAGARFAILLHPDGRRELARRRGIDYERDLAVLVPLERPSEPVPHFELRTARPQPGEWVAALGYPGGPRGDAHPTFTFGRVVEGGGMAQVSGFLDYGDAIRVDAPIYSGNSGGPLVDLEGKLVGINGAVDFGGREVGGLSIPVATVIDRTKELEGGIVRLPGGVVLDPATNPLLRLLDEKLDAAVEELMKAQLAGPGAGAFAMPDAPLTIPDAEEMDRRAHAVQQIIAKVQRRNRTLLAPVGSGAAGRAMRLTGPRGRVGFGTAIRGLGVVACASSFDAEAKSVTDGAGRTFDVVAYSPRHDLLLLRPQQPAAGPAFDAPEGEPSVGSFVCVLDEEGPEAAGIVSAHGRRIPMSALAAAGGPDLQERLRDVLEQVSTLAEAIGQDEIAELCRQVLKSFELRDGFQSGSPPRSYEHVLSIDAAVGPKHAGAPVIDLEGRLVGVVVANAHFGTSYAVPTGVVRAAFGEGGGALRGERALDRSASRAVEPGERPAREHRERRERRPAREREGLEMF